MDSRHTSSDKQRFTEAGEQAARVIGEFMSFANEFSKRLDGGFDTVASGNSESRQRHSSRKPFDKNTRDESGRQADYEKSDHRYQSDEAWKEAGDYLRELREAAGYTIDGFARAMNRQDARTTVEAAEAGREVFPDEWFDQAVEVLRHRDPLEFFDRLRGLYEPVAATADEQVAIRTQGPVDKQPDQQRDKRRQTLSAIFSDDETLAQLTDSQFEDLAGFMQSNYQAALELVRNKRR